MSLEDAGMEAIPDKGMFRVRWKGKAGNVPEICKGLWPSRHAADQAISLHYEGLSNKLKAQQAKKKVKTKPKKD